MHDAIIQSIPASSVQVSMAVNQITPVGYGINDCVYHPNMVPDADPHRKWIRTTIKRVTTVSFDMAGKPYSTSSEEVVSDTEVEYSLERKENWVKAP